MRSELLLLLLALSGCTDRCLRHSDCTPGTSCQQGQCTPPAEDTAPHTPPDLALAADLAGLQDLSGTDGIPDG